MEAIKERICCLVARQKAVAILLTLLYLNIKGIYIGPMPPAFISKNVFNILEQRFPLRLTSTPREDLKNILGT